MKYLLLIFSLMFISCNENDTKVDSIASTQENEIDKDSINEKEVAETSIDIKLEIHDFEGLKPYLSTNDDKTYIINFWATWCKPCIKELPYFEKLNENYKDKNVEVILVSLDFPSKYESNLIPYIKDNNLKSKVVALDDADSNSWIPQVSEEWSGAIPATLIFNRTDRKFYEGSFNYNELINAVKPFMQ